ATDAAGALALRPPALKPHQPLARFAQAHGRLGQPDAGIEQGLAPALDVRVALDRLIFEQRRDAGMRERALDESCGSRPARRVDREAGIEGVLEEARDRDVGEADVAEQEAFSPKLALEIVE